ncbi:MAG TPA: PspA/IM30 family protein [Acidimicrobiales bacterium]
MSQQSILGRVVQLARANINSMIDAAEDPQVMLDQLIRDYTANIQDAEGAVAQTIGNLRLIEDDVREHRQAAGEWGAKAAAASTRADELRASGATEEADRFDHLARVALRRQIDAENAAGALEPQIAQQTEVVDKLSSGLDSMREKLGQLRTKRDELVARSRLATAQTQVHDALRSVDVLDPTSEVSRFEEKIRRQEALARGQAELAASSLDAQFEDLEDELTDAEIDTRLLALKQGGQRELTR